MSTCIEKHYRDVICFLCVLHLCYFWDIPYKEGPCTERSLISYIYFPPFASDKPFTHTASYCIKKYDPKIYLKTFLRN